MAKEQQDQELAAFDGVLRGGVREGNNWTMACIRTCIYMQKVYCMHGEKKTGERRRQMGKEQNKKQFLDLWGCSETGQGSKAGRTIGHPCMERVALLFPPTRLAS